MQAASDGGGFFDVDRPEPPEPEVPPTPPWIQPPRDELPGRAVLDEVLFRSERAVLVLREIRRFTIGVEVRLAWFARSAGMSTRDWDELMQSVLGWHGPTEGERTLRVGMRLPDGTPLLPLHLVTAAHDPGAVAPPSLMSGHGGSGGGPEGYEGKYTAWLWWPERPDGDLELVVECRGLEIPELSHRIPADVLAAVPVPRALWADGSTV